MYGDKGFIIFIIGFIFIVFLAFTMGKILSKKKDKKKRQIENYLNYLKEVNPSYYRKVKDGLNRDFSFYLSVALHPLGEQTRKGKKKNDWY